MSFVYAMSNIHGCLKESKENLMKIMLSDTDKVIFCGDYIDYGRDSGGVLRCLYDL